MVERCSYRKESDFVSSNSNSNYSSFSSSLLDAIYRSIDQGDEEMVVYREGTRKEGYGVGVDAGANVRRGVLFKSDEEMANFQRACMIEKWMEKKATGKAVGGRKSVADLQVKKPRKDRESFSWSSSDSSCAGGGFFSSSEAETFAVHRPKPIRTGFEKEKIGGNRRDSEQEPKIEGGFSKTKLRALKIYGDLKKVKQPISPGGKLAGLLNSLFAGGNLKRNKIVSKSDDSPSLKSTNTSSCSSASSFSRSCLSKTPSSRGKHTDGGAKRSVRFSPVSVIVDEDCRGHKSLNSEINNYNRSRPTSNLDSAANYNNINTIRNAINKELMAQVMEKNRRVEEVARDLLRNYQRQSGYKYEHELPLNQLRKPHVKNEVVNRDFDYEEEEDDAAPGYNLHSMRESCSQLSRIRAGQTNNDGESSSTAKRKRPMTTAEDGGYAARLPLSEVILDCTERWFQASLKEAKSGDVNMQVLVAQMYYNGCGVSKDADKGNFWMTRASRVRSSVWKVRDKRPGYNASDSDSDESDGNS